jgi:hypothetical protein
VVESGPADVILSDPRHPYTKALLSASPTPDPELAKARPRVRLVGAIVEQYKLPGGSPCWMGALIGSFVGHPPLPPLPLPPGSCCAALRIGATCASASCHACRKRWCLACGPSNVLQCSCHKTYCLTGNCIGNVAFCCHCHKTYCLAGDCIGNIAFCCRCHKTYCLAGNCIGNIAFCCRCHKSYCLAGNCIGNIAFCCRCHKSYCLAGNCIGNIAYCCRCYKSYCLAGNCIGDVLFCSRCYKSFCTSCFNGTVDDDGTVKCPGCLLT